MSAHEDFSRADHAKGATDRSFGFVMAAFFTIIAALPLLHEPRSIRWWAAAIAAVFLLLALWWPAPLAPMNHAWTNLGLLLHKIVSPIVLALIFYSTVVPIGVIMRAIGKNPLRTQRDPASASYWIVRKPGPAPESMKNQF